ncbi:MAG: hypothetical protein JWN04_3182 [Myxococcaceae bacterium]|nr:hypothetical protein [Myxococcaceae bacterium]
MLRRVALLALSLWLLAASVQANGRMPGANDLVFNPGQPGRLVARATFGIVQSDDRGASWSWICEQAIDVSGVIADPPLGLTEDGSMVLLPPTGSALVSRDGGCSWLRVGAPLADKRGADLTVDPSDDRRLLVLTSTLSAVDGSGFGSYENLVVETRDSTTSWQLLSTLPTDFEAETIEVASSDAQRLYVSGSDTVDARLGVVFRSEDGGKSWTKSTLALPAGTGSLWISGIHPTDPDRVWLRVSARGDTLGLLPARLYLSTDKAQSFHMLASTSKGMFGFALSPDGASLAYGGPSDGLFVGPADGTGAFAKRSSLGVRCLRWQKDGALYVCASEPADPFSIGVSSDQGASFRALYSLVDTCPAACAAGSSFALSCQAAWLQTRPFIAASGAMCSVPWAAPLPMIQDAGSLEAGAPAPPVARSDAGSAPEATDAAGQAPDAEPSSQGCSCELMGQTPANGRAMDLSVVLMALLWWRRPREHGVRRTGDRA